MIDILRNITSGLYKAIKSKSIYILIIILLQAYVTFKLRAFFYYHTNINHYLRLIIALPFVFSLILIARKYKRNLLISGFAFWPIFILSAILNTFLNIDVHTALHQLPNAIITTCSLVALTYAVMRNYYILIWLPLISLFGINAIAYHEHNIIIDSTIISQILNATTDEVKSYLTTNNISSTIVIIVLAIASLYLIHLALKNESRFTLACSGMLLMLFCLLARTYLQPLPQNLACGLWPIKSLTEFTKQAKIGNKETNDFIILIQKLRSPADDYSLSSRLTGKEGIIFILHIGESVRYDHLTINGYRRNTTPNLNKLPNIINFGGCTASSGLTLYAIPTILTNARRGYNINRGAEYMPTRSSFIDILAKHGIICNALIPNDFFGNNAVAKIIQELLRSCKEIRSVSNNITEQVTKMKQMIASSPGSTNQFILINNGGSHFPYYNYDVNNPPFTPASSQAYGNSPSKFPIEAEKALNAYDNTIHYMDQHIHQILESLKGMPYLYIYVSDHGESVGEKNEWGRGFSFKESTFYSYNASLVPLFMVYSEQLLKYNHFKEVIENLHANKNKRTAHEHIYHTILGIMGIKAESYNSSLDLTSPDVREYEGPHPDDN